MKKLDINEIRKIELNILNDITNFCEKQKITYYLSVGTLLGAVRHKGFIPWDDDIDIMMPRPDYNRFIKEYDGKYKLLLPKDGLYYYVKAYDDTTIKIEADIDYKINKKIGVDIDIFPLDGSCNDKNVVTKQYKKACFLEMLLRLANQPIFLRKNPIKCINRIIPRIIGRKRIMRAIENNAQKFPYENNDYVIRMRRSTNGLPSSLTKSIYNPPIKLEFETNFYNVPKDYDTWLRTFYGNDYMMLPSVENRKQHIMECYSK